MLKVVWTKVAVGKYVIQAWLPDTDLFHHEVVTKASKLAVIDNLRNIFGIGGANPAVDVINNMFKIDPSYMAHQIPNIDMSVPHPISKTKMSLSSVIMDLNDNASWTREQIADWLDSLPDQPKFTIPED